MLRIFIILLLYCSAYPTAAALQYQLQVHIDPTNAILNGTAVLRHDQTTSLRLQLPAFLQHLEVDQNVITSFTNQLSLELTADTPVKLTFRSELPNDANHYIDVEHVFLTGLWYPLPDELSVYDFSVTLPTNFIAVSEADVIQTAETNDGLTRTTFVFPHPTDNLTLAASSQYQVKQAHYNDILLETYFFPNEAHLANSYLSHSQKYLEQYETLLTPYPYRRFAIVANKLPTGYGMPTFTLLGSQVIRLPFIVKTSLGHEILHSWFGNSVFIDYTQGNWAEGLTTYLADHYAAEQADNDVTYRKQLIEKYHAYVADHPDDSLSLRDFHSRHNQSSSAIGYGKAAMVFHALRQRLGRSTFLQALRDFITTHTGKRASWQDLQTAFAQVGTPSLDDFFNQWLQRADIPHLTFSNAQLRIVHGKIQLTFDIKQHNAQPYQLQLPLTIYDTDKQEKTWIAIETLQERIQLTLDAIPQRVVFDSDYDLIRHLEPTEVTPSLAQIFGASHLVAVVPQAQRALYYPLIEALNPPALLLKTPETLQYSDIAGRTVLLADETNPIVPMLLGSTPKIDSPLWLQIRTNPYTPQHSLMLFHSPSAAALKAVLPRLRHYGKYAQLQFDNGQLQHKAMATSTHGITVFEHQTDQVLETAKITNLAGIVADLQDVRVVFIGEQHDQYAHHLNQYNLIKQLHEAGHQVAIGMEMFQRPVQNALDAYLAGAIDEKALLTQTEYYQRWRYDYGLYKPILDYAKQQQLPVLALNMEREITHKVSQNGINYLEAEDKARLPTSIDFSNTRYRNDLKNVFQMHQQHAPDHNFEYFLQAQLLWDETMAETAAQFLTAHPEHILVILAGNGHIRYRYGIPQRLQRRTGLTYRSIVQDEAVAPDIADYVLTTTPIQGRETPVLGVSIIEKEAGLYVGSVRDNSPASVAGLKQGDVLVAYQSSPLHNLTDLKYQLFYSQLGETVTIKILRDGETLVKELTLQKQDND